MTATVAQRQKACEKLLGRKPVGMQIRYSHDYGDKDGPDVTDRKIVFGEFSENGEWVLPFRCRCRVRFNRKGEITRIEQCGPRGIKVLHTELTYQ